MSKHIHAEHMLQYAQDAAETDKPWERWQVRQWYKETIAVVVYGDWRDCAPSDMTFPDDCEYRRKPRTININGHEVPEPVRCPLNIGTEYWTPHISTGAHTNSATWTEHEFDYARLRNGVIHQTCGAAELHARALLSFTMQEESDE